MTLTDQSSFSESLPASLDLFITLYKGNMYDIDRLCDQFAKYEMCQKVRDSKTGKS